MKQHLVAVIACFTGLLAASSASAAVINGQYVPDSIVGQKDGSGNFIKYRLIFVTSGEIDADSPNVGYYQSFLNAQVAGSMLAGAVYNWQPVVSTYGGYSATQSVGSSEVVIYNTGGFKVADGRTDLLDGSLDAAVQYTQFGVSVGGNAKVWTGSYASGLPHMGGGPIAPSGYNLTLGSDFSGSNSVYGLAGATNGTWLEFGSMSNAPVAAGNGSLIWSTARIYGISGELSAIPEPASLVLWSLVAGVVGVAGWRQRRSDR